jgi:hypothetical protein
MTHSRPPVALRPAGRSLLGSQLGAAISTELNAAALGSCESSYRAFGNSAALVLGHNRHDPDRQPVGLRHVGRHEVNAGLLEPEQEMRIAGKTIELGNDQLGAKYPAKLESLVQLRPVGLLAALHLDKLLHELPYCASSCCTENNRTFGNAPERDKAPDGQANARAGAALYHRVPERHARMGARSTTADAVAALAAAPRAFDPQDIELALDITENEIASSHGVGPPTPVVSVKLVGKIAPGACSVVNTSGAMVGAV